jgi:hypothetical protein
LYRRVIRSMSLLKGCGLPLLAGLFYLAALPAPVAATTINLLVADSSPGHIGDGSVTSNQALAAMRNAARRWESILNDNLVINIWVDFSALGPGILGQAGSPTVSADYLTEFLPQVNSHLLTHPDPLLGALPNGSPLQGSLNVDLPAGITWSGAISMTFANARALGFTDPFLSVCNTSLSPNFGGGYCDGLIEFSSSFSFDFDPSDGISPGAFDLEGVTMHEIGHALGFVSEVDTVDCMLNGGCGGLGPVDLSVLDLYRFADCAGGGVNSNCDPATLSEFTTHARYMGTALSTVSSVVDQRWEMSRGLFTGDGRQASHFRDFTPSIGLMDPTAAPGERLSALPADQRMMQALGYSLAPVPEPSTWMMIGLGGAVLGWRRRRQA